MRLYPLILTILLPLYSLAQTDISGIINTYHKVTQVNSSNDALTLDNTSGLSPGDAVLIIQMKGATVSTTNGSAFGSVTSLNNAGNYELADICGVQDNIVYLSHQLAQAYTTSDKVQLVRIPQYISVRIIDTLKAAPWDSATGKGGVLAFNVANDLILNAPIYATGKGYKGGAYMTSSSTCTNFFPASSYSYNATNLNPQQGAFKGEGVAALAVTFSGGKGAAANGGGGGNNHNNGGGGGSNLAAGGLGGGNSSATGCTTANPGIGGYALSNSGGTKLFMGGGGGAGHANSGFFSTGGGSGGGIIIIQANNLISNGFKIMTNGVDGGNTTGDGASGGGAGGSMILDINNYIDAIIAEAQGGRGGDENDDLTSQRCYGEGGGGSGGSIKFTGSVPAGTINVSGGTKGNRINSLSCGAITSGTNGTTGNTIANYSFIESTTPSTFCSFPLDVHLLRFIIKGSGNNVNIEWKADHADELKEFILERKKDGGPWSSIYSVTPSQVEFYTYVDRQLNNAMYEYRLRMAEISGVEKYSVVRQIRIGRPAINFYPNPASDFIMITYPFTNGSKLKILNALGQVLRQKEFHRDENFTRLDISTLEKGTYYLMVDNKTIPFSIQ